MGTRKKLLQKFLAKPVRKDITFNELETLLKSFGYKKLEGRGSKVKFFKKDTEDMINLHKPHPRNTLKVYIVKLLQEKLKEIIGGSK
ncbi:MAG: type II toxin-antitoxin system HicA family toxin [Deltaproteobacteria bacterium]|nr:type II toxin-antitoxin system HicA family toxin [Deltaproteobacteria bacterium]